MSDLVVTGSSGFIGTHLCDRLLENDDLRPRLIGFDRVSPGASSSVPFQKGDLGSTEDLGKLAAGKVRQVVHLAAEAKVVIPFAEMQKFVDSNVSGTTNLLSTVNPETVFLASSSAVYGHHDSNAIATAREFMSPVGIYGMSKAMAELICERWAIDNGRAAISLRFGNVVGPRCGGLIRFLVDHAIKHADGSVPAQCRGGGKIVRDYLPIRYLIRLLMRALEIRWQPGSYNAFNIGTGRGLTNKAVAGIVQRVIRQEGRQLSINWDNPISAGESRAVVLDSRGTEELFELATPQQDEVTTAIEEATRYFLQ